MKKIIILSYVLLILSGCSNNNFSNQLIANNEKNISSDIQNKKTELDATQNKNINNFGNYLGSYYKGNYVWGGAMNLAWNELNENILQEKLKLRTDNEVALGMVEKLNNSPFSKQDLDVKSYYIKSGYGQETVDEINRESRKKFPQKSFGNLNLKLSPIDIVSYAYFLKEVEYKMEFREKNLKFNGQIVKGFSVFNEDQEHNVQIIKYEHDNKFIISLKLKDENDQLILAKGYDMEKPQLVINEINKNNTGILATMLEKDRFEAPNLHLDYHRDYVELIHKPLANKDFEKYVISKMFEKIKFDMDKKGARIENEAAIFMDTSAVIVDKTKPRNFILDQPYWIIMKRKDSDNPYFVLGVNNTELMEKSQNAENNIKKENFLNDIASFDTCNEIGKIKDECECIDIALGWDPVWICSEKIKCGNDLISKNTFKNDHCTCVVMEMPECGFDQDNEIIKCGSLECQKNLNNE